jgi:hypothetical protein
MPLMHASMIDYSIQNLEQNPVCLFGRLEVPHLSQTQLGTQHLVLCCKWRF